MLVTKETKIGEALSISPEIARILMNAGMHCVGCPASAMESIDEASKVHGMNADALVEDINEYIASAETEV